MFYAFNTFCKKMYNSFYFILLSCIWGVGVAVQIISIKKRLPYPITKDSKTNSVTQNTSHTHTHIIFLFFFPLRETKKRLQTLQVVGEMTVY